jgi:hypothetical protein
MCVHLRREMEFLISFASVVTLSSFFISMYLPWLVCYFFTRVLTIFRRTIIYCPYSSDQTWSTSIPVTLGFDSCLTSPCVYHSVDTYGGAQISVDPEIRFQFQTIRSLTLFFYYLSAFLAILSFLIYSLKRDQNFGCSRYLYPLSTCSLIITTCLYFPFMFLNLNGGFFREGSILLLFSTSFGMGISTIYFVESSPFSYTSIP